MKKHRNPQAMGMLTNELRGASLFFHQKPAGQEGDKTTEPQVGKSTSSQGNEPTSTHVGRTTSREAEEPTKSEVYKTPRLQVEKYTTHLRRDSIKRIKQQAVEEERKDYEVMQEAVDEYFARRGQVQEASPINLT
jgi:hypothetical protein